jgi:hypothetical protein
MGKTSDCGVALFGIQPKAQTGLFVRIIASKNKL